MRFAPTGSQRRGERVYANLNQPRVETKPGNGEAARRCLLMVRAASDEASAPRTCAKASSSSLLASRPTNCSDQWRKTQIWWLPRVWPVLDLGPKIHTICGAIYRGFLDRIVVGKDSNTFLVCIELYLMKIQKKLGRG
jgi:hypothetical protein